jgi:3-methyladenine DNA glycosylase AlkC
VKSSPPIPESILRRKGSPNTAGVPAEVRRLLDAGLIEAVNLSEWLVVDQASLAGHVLPDLGLGASVPDVADALRQLDKPTTPKRIAAVAGVLSRALPSRRAFDKALNALQSHRSDVVRTWGCHLIGLRTALTLAEKLQLIRPFAADPNMGVRECAWMAVREDIATQLSDAIRLLEPFVREADPNLRRFATEATRPRGVWCRHIHALRDDPALGLPLLEPVRSDAARYVQNSVANWLNDASKSQPDWVRQLCRHWERESPTPETAWISRRALRTLTKAAKPKP